MSLGVMSLFLAVDGGNSKTDVVLGTGDGRVLAYVAGPGTCHQTIGLPATLERLRRLVEQARAEAGVGTQPLRRAEVYLAGADLPEEIDLLTAAVAAEGWAEELRLDNDTFAVLRAGIDAADADAVAVVCGTGVNCLGRAADGRLARYPAIGRLSGDWGGGAHLGWLALWHAVRGEDGRGPATELARAVAAHFGAPTAEEVGKRIHLGAIRESELSGLAPLLFEVAAAGDAVARRLVARQADEIVALVASAARRLDLLDKPFVVVLGGGVVRARHPLLLDAVEVGLRSAAPRATMTVVDAPPVLGTALSALDALGADAEAHAALRRALPRPRT